MWTHSHLVRGSSQSSQSEWASEPCFKPQDWLWVKPAAAAANDKRASRGSFGRAPASWRGRRLVSQGRAHIRIFQFRTATLPGASEVKISIALCRRPDPAGFLYQHLRWWASRSATSKQSKGWRGLKGKHVDTGCWLISGSLLRRKGVSERNSASAQTKPEIKMC